MRYAQSVRRLIQRVAAVFAVLSLALAGLLGQSAFAAGTLVPIEGSGSTWSSNAMTLWAADVQQYGLKVDFNPNGSSLGRSDFKNKTDDFAVSEIPYGITDNGVTDTPPPDRKFAYMPIVAGGTSFMYQLHIGGHLVTNLRLSGLTLAKIFTANIINWSDPAIAADNPGITLPARQIVPVVRGDGSGTTAQFTTWLSKTYPDLWNAYCQRAGRASPCGVTSEYPQVPGLGFIAETQSSSVAGEVKDAAGEGTIGYVEYSYAKYANYPVAKLLNAAGYYTEPTPGNVAVALLNAQINTEPTSPLYLTQVLDNVYTNADPRTYPLSSYSYMIIPTSNDYPMNSNKGYTLGKFAYYFLCEGQQSVGDIGYSPLPINLVQAALAQVTKIPGVAVENTNIAACNNPTFSPDGTNLLATTAAQPQACDKQGVTMCSSPTGGATTPTQVQGVAPAPTTTPGSAPTVKGTKAPPTKGSPGTSTASPKPGATPTVSTTATGGTQPNSAPTVSGSPQPTVTDKSGKPIVTTAPAVTSAAPKPNISGAIAPPADPENPDAPAPAVTGDLAVPGSAVGAVAVNAVPVSLASPSGWTSQDTFMVLAVLLCLLLVVAPPLISRRLSRRKTS
jgi:phosphate ABC transporter phosphate-binding protein